MTADVIWRAVAGKSMLESWCTAIAPLLKTRLRYILSGETRALAAS